MGREAGSRAVAASSFLGHWLSLPSGSQGQMAHHTSHKSPSEREIAAVYVILICVENIDQVGVKPCENDRRYRTLYFRWFFNKLTSSSTEQPLDLLYLK